jgi:chorismate mutase
MNPQLLLSRVRAVLIRQEETIVFSLIERAQFLRNERVYLPGVFGPAVGGDSLSVFLLRETEKIHSKMRRYTSPDENPFCSDLPDPLLPALAYPENPLRPNRVNINDEVRRVYESEIVPVVCTAGDDGQYGSSVVCDVACLQALSRRIHYGKFVAESKMQSNPQHLSEAIRDGDRDAMFALVTDERVEREVVSRVRRKAELYGQLDVGESAALRIDPDTVADIYRKWIIPLNKRVQVEYLAQRGV